MDLSTLAKLAIPLTAVFVGVLWLGTFAWSKLGTKTTVLVAIPALFVSMALLYPYLILDHVYDPQVLAGLFVTHICGGTIVASIIAKWVENKAKKEA